MWLWLSNLYFSILSLVHLLGTIAVQSFLRGNFICIAFNVAQEKFDISYKNLHFVCITPVCHIAQFIESIYNNVVKMILRENLLFIRNETSSRKTVSVYRGCLQML